MTFNPGLLVQESSLDFKPKAIERHYGGRSVCILAHQYNGPKSSPPHDHGPTWAIYAQARGETEMTDYELLSPASEDKAGRVKPLRTYMLRPGDAHVYEPGALHSPRRTAPTSLLRVEGTDMSQVNRLRFEAE